MQQHLTEQLWAHIIVDHPELMNRLKESHSVNSYLEEKVNRIMPYLETLIQEGFANHAITELCVKAMTLELGPSRYRYLRYMLEDEFPDTYERYAKEGIVTYEVIKMVEAFAEAFEEVGFNADNYYEDEVYNPIAAFMEYYLSTPEPAAPTPQSDGQPLSDQ